MSILLMGMNVLEREGFSRCCSAQRFMGSERSLGVVITNVAKWKDAPGKEQGVSMAFIMNACRKKLPFISCHKCGKAFLLSIVVWAFIIVLFYTPASAQEPQPIAKPNQGVFDIETELKRLQKGLRLCWIRERVGSGSNDVSTVEMFYWHGNLDVFTYTNVFAQNRAAGEFMRVWGQKGDKAWTTSAEAGVLTIDDVKRARIEWDTNPYFKEELTNVLSFGFGCHWDVHSIYVDADGKMSGKYKDKKTLLVANYATLKMASSKNANILFPIWESLTC